MKVKRFFAPDMSTAMRTVREEVGPDAVILSNNSVAGGVEVIVALDYTDGPQVAIKSLPKQKKSTASRFAVEQELAAKALVGMKKPVRTAEDLERARQRMSVQAAKRSAESLMQPKTKDNQLNFDDRVWDDVLAALGKEERISKPVASKSSHDRRVLEEEVDRALGLADESSLSANRVKPAAQVAKPTPQIERSQQNVSAANRMRQRLDIDDAVPHLKEVAAKNDDVIQSMRSEIDELKSMLRARLSESATASPAAASPVSSRPVSASTNPVIDRLSLQFSRMNLQAGISAKLLQGIEADQPIDKAWKVALRRLSDAIPTVGEDLAERGGILAFVGATGVGKTTSIGKLATRYVLRHGSAGIALVTTDSYRIAAHEQLKTFGRILDIPVRVVDENHSLDETLDSLRDKRLILVDTSGLSTNERLRVEQLQMLADSSYRIKKIFVMPSTAQYGVLEASYQQFKSLGLNAVLMSKLDEAVSLGEATSFVAEHRLPLAYIADGQKIPDDIEVARANAFVSRAVVLSEQTAKKASDAAVESPVIEEGNFPSQQVG